MKKYLILTATIAFTLLFVSCPEPLTEDIVTSAQDSIAPVIEIYSPSGNAEYLSVVEFEIHIKDDAENENDEKGDISIVEFSVSNDDFRGGRILVSPDGIVTQDEEGGSDIINYDPETGLASFSISTIEPNILSGLISVTITVTDRNSNSSQESLTLFENEGPWLELLLTDVDSGLPNKFLAGQYITMSGSVGNSVGDKTSATEITEISWDLADTIKGELVLAETATYLDSYSGAQTNYYNSTTGLYEYRIEGYVTDDYAELFTFNPDTRTFSATIYMNDNLDGKGSVLMNFSVLDQNGHELEKTLFISENKIGPNPVISPLDDGSFGHFSTVTEEVDLISGILDRTEAELNSFKVKLSNGSLASTDYSDDAFDAGVVIVGKDFEIDLSAHISDLLDDTDFSSTNITYLDLKVEGLNGVDTTLRKALSIDDIPPTLTINTLRSKGTDNPTYVNGSNDIEIFVSANENLALKEADEVIIEVHIGDYTETLEGENPSMLTLSPADWKDVSYSDDYIPIWIDVSDRVGNTATYYSENHPTVSVGTQLSQNLMYYDSSVLSSTFITDVSFNADTFGLDTFAQKNEPVYLRFNSGRNLEEINTVYTLDGTETAGISTSADGDSKTYNYQYTYNEATPYTDESIISKISLIDMAGNTYPSILVSGAVTLDTEAPDLDNLKIRFAGTGIQVSDETYINSEYDETANMQLESISPVDTAIDFNDLDANYWKFEYDLFETGVTAGGAATSYSIGSIASVDDGSFTATVNIYDKAGNVENKNLEFYVDTKAPTLPDADLEFLSNNGDMDTTNTAYAKLGDTAYLSFSVDDELQDGYASGIDVADIGTYTVKIMEVDALDSAVTDVTVIGDVRTYTRTLNDSAFNNTNIEFSIVVKDKAGNTSTITEDSGYSGSPVMFYADPLDMNIVYSELAGFGGTKYSDAGDFYYYLKEGSVIKMTASDGTRELQEFSIGIYDTPDVVPLSLDGSSTASEKIFTHTMLSGDDQGELEFNYTFKDKADNEWASTREGQVNSSHGVIYDRTAPDEGDANLSFLTLATGMNSPNYINAAYVDDSGLLDVDDSSISGNYLGYKYDLFESGEYSSGYSTADGIGITVPGGITDQTYNAKVIYYDKALNYSGIDTFVIKIDKLPPVINVDHFTNNNDFNSHDQYAENDDVIELQFDASDVGQGIDTTLTKSYVKIAGQDKTPGSFGLDKDSNYTVDSADLVNNKAIPFEIKLTDLAGNSVVVTDDNTNYIMYYDGNPTLDDDNGSVEGNEVKISIVKADDAEGSGNWAVSGDDIKLVIESARMIEVPSFTFDFYTFGSSSSSVTAKSDGVNPKVTYTIVYTTTENTVEHTGLEELEFTIVKIQDFASNKIENLTGETPTDDSIIQYDGVAPDENDLSITLSDTNSGIYENKYINSANPGTFKIGLTLSASTFSTYRYDKNIDPGGLYSTYSVPFSLSSPEDGSTLTYHFQLRDAAGNVSGVKTHEVIVDTTKPSITGSTGVDSATAGEDTLVFHVSEELKGDANITYTGTNANDIVYNSSADTITITTTTQLVDDSQYTITMPSSVTDLAGNEMEYPSYTALFTSGDSDIDKMAPTVNSATLTQGNGTTTKDTLTFDLSEKLAIGVTAPGVSIGGTGTVGAVISYDSNITITITAAAAATRFPIDSGTTYTLSFTAAVEDLVGNTMAPLVYNWTSNGSTTLVASGLSISTPTMTLQPDIIPDTTRTSYKSVRTYDYSSSNSIRAEEGEQFVSADMSEISSHEKASTFMAYPVSYRRGSAAVDIPAPERIIENLDTSDTVLKGAMDEIAFNEAEYEAQLQSLMTPNLSRARLKDMVNALEPVIVEPETITVSATPFLMGAATEIQVVVGTDIETGEKASGALLIQILGVLLMALLSIGFVMVLKKMSKT